MVVSFWCEKFVALMAEYWFPAFFGLCTLESLVADIIAVPLNLVTQ